MSFVHIKNGLIQSDNLINVNINGTGSLTFSNDNKIGIGTTSPSQKLDVSGITNTIGLTSVQTQDTATTVELNVAPDTWTCGTGWTRTSTGTYTKATGSLNTLDYNITTNSGDRIIIQWNQTAGNTGYLTPKLGTVTTPQGQIVWWNNHSVDLVSNITGTITISFVPSSDYAGTINAITVKKLTSGIVANLVQKDISGNISLEIRSNKGLSNQGVGYRALYYNTTGTNNTANGMQALFSNTTGFNNTANGLQALFSNTTGYSNTANGMYALYANTTGYSNTANGYQALYSNTTGTNNTANGYQALNSNTTGYNNTANGYRALFSNTTGHENTANGMYALHLNTTGYSNTANGYMALFYNTTGYNNIANGLQALYYNRTGYNNTANGVSALFSNTTGYNNTANGFYALFSNTTGYNNTANGYRALNSNTTGYQNTANGHQALYSNTTGSSNTANGMYALNSNTTGYQNTANGFYALFSNTTGTNNTANGYYALFSNTTGYENTASGYRALNSNITGVNNTANGTKSLYYNTTGNNNTANGYLVLFSNTTGYNNTANGYQAGRFIANGITGRTTGNYGVYIGSDTKASADGTTNEVVIGYNAIGAGSNTVVLGNDSITKTLLKGNVGIGTDSPGYKLAIASSGVTDIGLTSGTSLAGSSNVQRIQLSNWYNSSLTTSELVYDFFGNYYNGGVSSHGLSLKSGRESYSNIWFRDAINGIMGGFVNCGYATPTLVTTSNFLVGGNVGIGTSNPLSILTIKIPSTSNHTIGFQRPIDGNISGRIGSWDITNNIAMGALTMWTSGNDPLLFGTNGTERMRILSNGDVGIGAIAFSDKLYVNGNIGLPLTSTTSGMIKMNGVSYLHSFGNVYNTFVGYLSGNITLTTATENTFIGHQSGNSLTTGSYNVGIGRGAGSSLTTGIMNTLIGRQSGQNISTGINNTFIGCGAGEAYTGDSACAVGYYANRWNASGYGNISLGSYTNYWGTNTANTISVGNNSLYNVVSGNNNIGIGYNADYFKPIGLNASLVSGTALGIGMYYYRLSFVLSIGESATIEAATITTTSGNQAVSMSSIPVYSGPYLCTGRKLYRTKVGIYGIGPYYLVTTINDNTTTTYTDTTPDTSLTTVIPSLNSSIIIGSNAIAFKSNQLILGSDQTEIYLGQGVYRPSPSAISLFATSGQGTDNPGADLFISAGASTGTGLGGRIAFKTSTSGTTGSLFNTLTTKMIIDNNGNVGIGTNAPTALLNVVGNILMDGVGSKTLIMSRLGGASLTIGTSVLSTGGFIKTTTSSPFSIGTNNNYNITISPSGSVSVNTNQLFVDNSTGYIGIGNVTPRQSLEVTGHILLPNNRQLIWRNSFDTGNDCAIKYDANNSFKLLTGGNERITVLSNGYVGIGTSSPSVKFVVSNNNVEGLEVNPGVTTTLLAYNKSTSTYSHLSIFANTLIFGGGGSAEHMRISSNGNVGIGITNPTYKLDVNGSINIPIETGYYTNTNRILCQSSNGSINGLYGIIVGFVDYFSKICFDNSNNGNIRFLTGNTSVERMTIDGIGNLGIGVAPDASYRMNILGDVLINGELYASAKHFRIPDKDIKDKTITYSSLEGPENGVYVRGKVISEKNNSEIEFPREWKWLIDETQITVQLTCCEFSQRLIYKIMDNKIVIKNKNWFFNRRLNCSYIIYGERKDVKKLQIYS